MRPMLRVKFAITIKITATAYSDEELSKKMEEYKNKKKENPDEDEDGPLG